MWQMIEAKYEPRHETKSFMPYANNKYTWFLLLRSLISTFAVRCLDIKQPIKTFKTS